MFSKRFKYLAGMAAVALSGHAFAQTTTSVGTGSSIFLTINDTTTGAGYVYDTGLSATSFNGNASIAPITLGSTAYTNFLDSVGSGDTLEYSVVGAEEPSAGTSPSTVDITGLAAPGVKTNGGITEAYSEISDFLIFAANPAGADSYQTAASNTGFYSNGTEASVSGDIADSSDSNALGAALKFYQLTASATSGHAAGTETTFAGSWLLSGNTLTYTAVPLPAPLALLLSGLGLMSVITRRRRSAIEAV
jgi:hypothetical protein